MEFHHIEQERVGLLRRREAAERMLRDEGMPMELLAVGFLDYWIEQGKTAAEIVRIAMGPLEGER